MGAAALNAGGSVLRWRGLSSPEFAAYGVPGVNPAGVWLWGGRCDTRKPPEAKARWIRTRGGALDGDGGSGRRTSSALACSGSYGAPWLRELAQKQEGVGAQLTGGSRRPGL